MNYRIFLLLGTNLGDRPQNLARAAENIAGRAGHIVQRSSVYITAPWGKTDQPAFYNQVLEIESQLSATSLLHVLQTIENEMGRLRQERWGPRLIDIDLLFYGEAVLDGEDLKVPHPGIPARRFTLLPLAEIAPDWRHPALQKTVRELLEECTDALAVTRLPPLPD